MVVAADVVRFGGMNEAQLRNWVEANPGHVNDRGSCGNTPLYVAVSYTKSLAWKVCLLDEKGADVNATAREGLTPLYDAPSLDILTALLDRCADPTLPDDDGLTPLMPQSRYGPVENVARLLQIRASEPLSTCKILRA